MLRISVIVPFYNAAFSIESCLQALLHQDYPSGEYEIIAVDNNSTDDSALRVQRFERVRLVRESRQGSYAACNAAAIQSTGEILAFKSVQAMMGPRVYPLKRMRAIESYENARVEYILKRGDARTYRLHEQHGRAKVRAPALRAF